MLGEAWLLLDDTVVAYVRGDDALAPQEVRPPVPEGQRRLELRFLHRAGPSGLVFRLLDEDARWCPPAAAAD